MKLCEVMSSGEFQPSEHERMVLANILAAGSPQLAGAHLRRGTRLNAAANKLEQLRLIQVLDDEASLTPAGEAVARAQALIDPETGEPSEEARELAAIDSRY